MDNTPQHHLQQPTEVAPSTPSTTTPSTKKRTQTKQKSTAKKPRKNTSKQAAQDSAIATPITSIPTTQQSNNVNKLLLNF